MSLVQHGNLETSTVTMLVSVTALGARSDRTRGAARDIVNYLEGGVAGDRARPGTKGEPAPTLSGTASGPGGYYSDSPEQPGRWRGTGIAELAGAVDAERFTRILLGQDPHTGEQLVTATGSAGRAKNHGKGLPPGDPNELFTLPLAAEATGVHRTYLWRLANKNQADQHEHGPSTAPETASTGRSGPSTGHRSGTYLSAEKVDGQWMVTRAEVERFIADRQVPQVVMAYDVTFSAPKSLSILWATGSPEVRALVEEAFEAGVARGVAYLEGNAVWVRRGRASEPAGEMIAASYRHSTNRELEPQLHEHVVITNMGTSPDGRVQALDGRGLFAHATTAGYLAEAEMQHSCNRRGIAWTATHRGIANVEGVGDDAIRAMSTRRQQILNLTNELGAHSTHARQQAALMTRAGKTTGTDPTALRRAWAERLATHGFGPAELHAATTAPPARLWTPADTDRLRRHLAGLTTDTLAAVTRHKPQAQEVDETALFESLAGAEGICAGGSVFSRSEALVAMANHPVPAADGAQAQPLLCGASRLIELTDQFLASEHVVALTDADEPLYTTVEMLG
ncbi:MAG: MobF family relaxase, partial [Microthrixaceae bacterium]